MSLSRRAAIIGASALVVPNVKSRPASAQSVETGPFKLPALTYSADALEAVIDAQTMQIHHDKHHAAYVSNLNAIVRQAPQLADVPPQEILANLTSVPEALRSGVRNNLGGHVNHTMFWSVMGANGSKPSSSVSKAIARDFDDPETMRALFDAAGAKVFGSGWVFVTIDRDHKLSIETRSNQDTPLMDGKRVLFGNDMWEHAYYLRYQNRRSDYLKAWWGVLNWTAVSERYEQALSGKLTI